MLVNLNGQRISAKKKKVKHNTSEVGVREQKEALNFVHD